MKLTPSMSFMSDVALYDMSYADIFVRSTVDNIVWFHAPWIAMYRMMRFSDEQIANFALINVILKTGVEATILAHQ